ncbi:MAG: ABC transporter ATP-binding protein [Bacteroidaceae bacterium]|nr:ABC transporter ATP-binding protein [Bacteroidaceae bacterium]
MLTLSSLLIGHRAVPLCTPLSATLPAGCLCALVGRNGTGKSTLLRTLCGLQKPLGGTVEWDGRDVRVMTRRELARSVAVVLTARPDTAMLTVRDVVATGRMPYTPATGRLSAADRAAVEEAMRLAGIESLAARRLTTLSDGERQRAMIAKALAQQTPAILLDEPTAFLDYVAREEVFALLHSLARDASKLILLSTHDLQCAARHADRIWHLTDNGLRTGTPELLTFLGL